ncbi:MAG: ParB/RepB/Spo0J family partition protein [Pseudomonadota bacterium]|nr:ParB/RepB/Spo0J family partition protein [Pseudomonadota bacterium]
MISDRSKRKNLGRGLDALLGKASEKDEDLTAKHDSRLVSNSNTSMPIEAIGPTKLQPRKTFDKEELDGLAESIKENGIIQPIIIRKNSGEGASWEIVAGERRWRAAQLARLHEIPVIIKELTDSQTLEIALVENLQRSDLSVIEEAQGYGRLAKEFGYTHEELGRQLGKSRSHISNILRLLELPDGVKAYLNDKDLSFGHARALLNTHDPEHLAKIVVQKKLNVRQTEKLVQRFGVKAKKPEPTEEKDSDTLLLEKNLSAELGLNVSIQFSNSGGKVSVAYKTLEQLDNIIELLRGERNN